MVQLTSLRIAAIAVAAGALCFCLLAALAYFLKRKRRNSMNSNSNSNNNESSSMIVLPRASMQPMTTDRASEPEQYGQLEMIPPKKHARRDQQGTNGAENPRHLARRKSSSRRRKEKAGYEEAPTLLDINTGTSNIDAGRSQYGAPPVTGSAGLPSSTQTMSVVGTTGELMKPIAATKESENEEEDNREEDDDEQQEF